MKKLFPEGFLIKKPESFSIHKLFSPFFLFIFIANIF